MNSKTTLPISKARNNIFKIAKDVQNPNVYYTLTENGFPKVVIMSAEEYESIMETLEVILDFPKLEDDKRKARKDLKNRNVISLEDLLLKRSKRKNVSSRSIKKRTKRPKKHK